MKKKVQINNNKVNLVIWDVAGQSRFTSYRYLYYKGADAIILVYDITRKMTFDNLNKWYFDAKKHTIPETKLVLLGNKSDLENKRNIERAEGRIYSINRDAIIFEETSAKTGYNVESSFLLLAKELVRSTSLVRKKINNKFSNF